MYSRIALIRQARRSLTSSVPRLYAKEAGSVKEFAPAGVNHSYDSNKITETNRLEKTLSKFWEKVLTEEKEDGFHVKLDSKTIKTPLGFDLVIPKEKKTLAFMLTNEWKSLPSLQIKPYLVPLTSIVSRCIDLENAQKTKDEEMFTKIGDLSSIKTLLLRYLDTDTLLIFSPIKDCDGDLRDAQEKLYRPIIKSMEEFLSKFSDSPVELSFLDSDLDGMRGNKQSDECRAAAMKYLDSLDVWELVALEKATLTAKSFLTGVAILRTSDVNDEFSSTLEELATAATLETVVQTAIWGEVEDSHDVDKVDVRRHLASACLIVHKE